MQATQPARQPSWLDAGLEQCLKLWTRAEENMAERPYLWLMALLAPSMALLAVAARFQPMQFEEVVSYWVAKSAPGLGALYANLLTGVDNHPPLDYSLRHLSMRLLGDSPLVYRLPSLAGFAMGMAAIFALVRRHAGSACAWLAALLFASSQATAVGTYGRSYGVLLGVCAVSLWLWRQAADGHKRTLTLPALGVSMAASFLLHYMGPIHVFCVAVAEGMRTIQRRRLDWPMWVAIAAALAPLPVVWPLIQNARSYSKGFWTPVNVEACLEIYRLLFMRLMAPLIFGMALYAIFRMRKVRDEASPAPDAREAAPETAAALYLVCLPLVIFVLAKAFTGALFFRYAVSMIVGACFLFGVAAGISRPLRLCLAATLGLLTMALLAGKAASAARGPGYGGMVDQVRKLAGNTPLPLVLDSPQTFLETWHYLDPAVQKRVYYLVDADAAYRIQRQNVDQRFLGILGPIAGFQAVDRMSFLERNPKFVLVYEGGWLLESIGDRIANLKIAHDSRVPMITIEQGAPAAQALRRNNAPAFTDSE
jgi:hypothetical protein